MNSKQIDICRYI